MYRVAREVFNMDELKKNLFKIIDNSKQSRKAFMDNHEKKRAENIQIDQEMFSKPWLDRAPVGALIQGQPQEFVPRVQDTLSYLGRSPETKMSFAGDMTAVNPGGFAGALKPVAHFAQSTTPGAPINTNPSSYQNLRKVNIGSLQQSHQMPDLTAYEKAIKAMDFPKILEIAAKHPNDARFMVHETAGLFL